MTRRPTTAVGGRARWLVLLAVVGGWYVTLSPSSLGGPVTPLLTRGTSMEPTYMAGDLVIAYRERRPEIGDVVAARHETGVVFVHRLVGEDDAGYITQGDNLAVADPWRVRDDAVLGTVRLRVPGAARVVSTLGEPVVLGALAAAFVLALAGLRQRERPPRSRAGEHAAAAVVCWLLVGAVAVDIAHAASMTVSSAQLLAFGPPPPVIGTNTYLVTGGGGGGGGGCHPVRGC